MADLLLTLLSFLLGLVAVAMTLLISHNQSKLSEEINVKVGEQSQLLNEVREVYADEFVSYVHTVSRPCVRIIMTYQKYLEKGENDDRKSNLKNRLETRLDSFLVRKYPKFDNLELLKAFGKKIFEPIIQHRHSFLSEHSYLVHEHDDIYKYDDTDAIFRLFIRTLKNLTDDKDIFLEFCNKNIQEDDKQHQKEYDTIKEFYNKYVPDDSNDEFYRS
jgi:hypothetical protein